MSKYAGRISIIDDSGKMVFTRDLTNEEMVEHLASALANPAVSELTPTPVAPPEGKGIRDFPIFISKGQPIVPAKPSGQRFATRPCCGSTGTRHTKDCPKNAGAVTPPPEQKQEPLTQKEWTDVKSMHTRTEKASLAIAQEMSLPLQQVNYAILSLTYDAYRAHLAHQK